LKANGSRMWNLLSTGLEPRTFGVGAPSLDVTNRLGRIWYLKATYYRLVTRGLYRIGVAQMIRTQFPYILPDTLLPPSMNIEFTNHCQLRCTYCTSPLKLRPQGLMSPSTFDALADQLRRFPVPRIRVVGNGEPTLHREFSAMVRTLRTRTRYLELKSNWQLITDDVLDAALLSVNALRVSVDSNSKEDYERLRPGGSFETLLNNLRRAIARRNELRTKAVIVVALMLRPSDRMREGRLLDFWQPYCDVVAKQYVLDMATGENDAYNASFPAQFPRCSLPFKELKVLWNGDVPLCKYSHIQTRDKVGLLIGNITSHSLEELWTHHIMRQYRDAHRWRNYKAMPICKGCIGT
jgi:organic radical activating enzyme